MNPALTLSKSFSEEGFTLFRNMDELYLNRRFPIIIFLNCLQSLPNKNAAQAGDQNKLDHFSNKGTRAESCGWWIMHLLFVAFIDINFNTGHSI